MGQDQCFEHLSSNFFGQYKAFLTRSLEEQRSHIWLIEKHLEESRVIFAECFDSFHLPLQNEKDRFQFCLDEDVRRFQVCQIERGERDFFLQEYQNTSARFKFFHAASSKFLKTFEHFMHRNIQNFQKFLMEQGALSQRQEMEQTSLLFLSGMDSVMRREPRLVTLNYHGIDGASVASEGISEATIRAGQFRYPMTLGRIFFFSIQDFSQYNTALLPEGIRRRIQQHFQADPFLGILGQEFFQAAQVHPGRNLGLALKKGGYRFFFTFYFQTVSPRRTPRPLSNRCQHFELLSFHSAVPANPEHLFIDFNEILNRYLFLRHTSFLYQIFFDDELFWRFMNQSLERLGLNLENWTSQE